MALEARYIATAGSLIELAAAAVIAWRSADALVGILRRQGSDRARQVIAEGVLAALSFSVTGTLLKTIALNSWAEIRMFAFTLLLRTLLKRVFQAEKRGMLRRQTAMISTRSR